MCLIVSKVPQSQIVKCRPVESDDFMSSNKSWKTLLYTMKLEKITSRLNLRKKLKIYLSKWVDKYHENFCPRKWLFLPNFCHGTVCPKQLTFPSFKSNFTTLLFSRNFCFFNQEVPVRSPPLSLISGFFTGGK